MQYQEIREKVIYYSLQAQKVGLIKGTSGNISLRSSDRKVIAITPTSIPYELLKPQDIPLIDEFGKVLDGEKAPSSETPMHTLILRHFGYINAVVHTHALFCTVLSVINKTLPAITVPQLAYHLAPIENVPFEIPGTEELGNAVVKALEGNKKAVLLQNHGMLVVDTTLEQAFMNAEYLEEAAQIAYYSLLAGGMNSIPQEMVEKFNQMTKGRAA